MVFSVYSICEIHVTCFIRKNTLKNAIWDYELKYRNIERIITCKFYIFYITRLFELPYNKKNNKLY